MSNTKANARDCPKKCHYGSFQEASGAAERRSAAIQEPLKAFICRACSRYTIGHPKRWLSWAKTRREIESGLRDKKGCIVNGRRS